MFIGKHSSFNHDTLIPMYKASKGYWKSNLSAQKSNLCEY